MKNKIMLLITVLTLLFCFGCDKNKTEAPASGNSIFSRPVVEKPEGGRKEWNDVSSFVCYYGDFDIEFQSQFDVVIMHTATLRQYDKETAKAIVKQLQDAGCYIISYITIGEDDSLNVGDGLGEGGYASYYIYENGVPKPNNNWGSWFVDAGNPVWQAKVIEESGEILSYGVDGLFLDTLDTVDIDNSTLPGMADLVKNLKTTYPEAKLVANRGFTVLPYISQYIDGMMFESFNTTIDFTTNMVADLTEESREWNEDIACNTINAIRRYDYFPIFALDYVNEYEYDYMTIDYYNRSWQYDFIPFCTYDFHLGTVCYPKDAEGNLLKPTSKRGELALSKLASSELEGFNGDNSANNLAYVNNGAKVTVDSTFNGYNIKALNDGWYVTEDNHVQKNWAKEAWASTDNKYIDHWIEFEFAEAKEVSQVVVHWANDNGTFYSPRKAVIQIFANGQWQDVCTLTNDPSEPDGDYKAFEYTWTFTFNTVTTNKIRVLQPKGCGAHDKFNDAVRPGVMWVSEIEIYKEAQ
jgi:hypothetical protein